MKKTINILKAFAICTIISISTHLAKAEDIIIKTDTTQCYSLGELVNIALQNNDIRAANMEVDKARYKRNQSIAKLLPNINVKGSYGNTIKKQKMYFDIKGGSHSPFGKLFGDGFEVGQTHNIQAGLNMGMPLVVPQLWEALSIDESGIKLSIEKARESKISLITEVKNAYLSLLLAKESYQVFKKNYEQAQESYKQIKKKFDKGLVAEFDVIRQETKLKSALPNLINAKHSIILAKAHLNILLDRDPSSKISVEGSLQDFEKNIYEYSLQNKGIVVDSTDIEANTTIRQLDIQKEIAKKVLKTKKLAYLPTISLGFMYQYAFASNVFDLSQNKRWYPFSVINLNISIPIFSSGDRYYSLKQSQVDLISINLRRASIENKLNMQIMNEKQQINNALQVFISAKDAMRTAKRGYEIAKVRYSSGSSSLLELNDAELSVLQASLNYDKAIYDFMKSTFELQKIQGSDTI